MSKRSLLAHSLVVGLALPLALPAYSHAPVLDEQQAALAQDDTYNPSTTAHHNDLLNQLHTLQQEVQELRGQLEVHTHQLNTLQQPQSAHPTQDTAQVHSSIPPVEHNELTVTTPSPKGTNEQISYLNAYELINSKQYDAAKSAMQEFVSQYPHSGYAANAYYWIGELCLLERNYPEAIHNFERVLKEYPASNKSSASLLKIGFALAEAGKIADAKQQLQAVIKNYPDTNAAHLALAKLETLRKQ